MKRLALVLAAAVLGTGCLVTTDDPVGTLDMTWRFIRTKHGGATAPPYACATAWIDTIVVSSSIGRSYEFACRSGNLEGAVFNVPVGAQTVTVTGYRGSAALYQSSFNVSIAERVVTPLDADLYGLPDDLDIYAWFLDRDGFDVGWTTCGAAGVTTLTWTLVDSAGTPMDSNSVSCTNPAGVSYAGAAALDRDQYTIRMQGFPSAGPETFDSASTRSTVPYCDGQAFDHYGPNVGDVAWDVLLYDVSTNGTFCP